MHRFLIIFIVSSLIFMPLTACNSSTQTSNSADVEHSEDDGHDHSKDNEIHSEDDEVHSEDDGHDHSKDNEIHSEDDEVHSEDDGHDHSDHELHSRGGQIIESDPYHIELVTKNKDAGTELQLFLLHEAEERVIADAQVTANVLPPGGEPQTLELVYEPAEESYKGLIPSAEKGSYNLVVQTEINGEKINSRFSVE